MSTAGKAQEPAMQNHLYTSNGSKGKPQILVTKQVKKANCRGKINYKVLCSTHDSFKLTRDQGNQIFSQITSRR